MRYLSVCLAVAIMAVTPCAGAREKVGKMKLTSPAFTDHGAIPALYTCDGRDVSPPLTIGDLPAEARSLALVVDDPDAPSGMWVHWVVWNIDPRTTEIGEGAPPPGASQGKNDWRRTGYGGPCPPSGTHRYFFRLYALDALMKLGPSTTKADLEKAMHGHIIAEARLVGVYKRH